MAAASSTDMQMSIRKGKVRLMVIVGLLNARGRETIGIMEMYESSRKGGKNIGNDQGQRSKALFRRQ